MGYRPRWEKNVSRRGLSYVDLLFIILAVSGLGFIGCGMDGPQSTLKPGGPVALLQANVFFVTLMVCLGIFLATGGLLVYTIWRYRARPGQPDDRTLEQEHGNPKVELMLMGIVLLLLLVIAIPNLQALFVTSTLPRDRDAVQVNVVGRQWWWSFEYPELDVVTANELHVPVGRPVRIQLHSADVIHSFWIPKLAGKMDLIPNRKNVMWFQADAPGTYYGQCAEFCGASHAHMRFRVIAQTEAAFADWLLAQQQPAQAPSDPLAIKGSRLFMAKGCMACHAIDGTPAQGAIAPNLTHFASRQTMAAGMLPNSTDHLTRWLQNPRAVKPATLMPNLGLNEAEVSALVAYLQHLQ